MIYYFGYYDCFLNKSEDRIVSPAANNKSSYIIRALAEASNKNIEVVSPAETKKHEFVSGGKQKIDEKTSLKTFASFSSKNKLVRGIGHIFTKISVLFYLVKNVKKDDMVIVYHSLFLMKIVRFLKKIKKCSLIIEVEEIYGDVNNSDKQRKKELEYLQIADGYIFVTEMLRDIVNMDKKYAIAHGTYNSVYDYGLKFDDGKIHIVYAGTFKYAKGVAEAISTAEFLDDRYVIEILGKGNEEEERAVKQQIQEVSSKTKCKINLVGYKSGQDFDSYIQACQIGLSPQYADSKFNATSFPSKILMYMSNGLRVVSVKIPAIETSNVGEYIYYFDGQNSESIAAAIKDIDIKQAYDSRDILENLHKDFVEQLKKLLIG